MLQANCLLSKTVLGISIYLAFSGFVVVVVVVVFVVNAVINEVDVQANCEAKNENISTKI